MYEVVMSLHTVWDCQWRFEDSLWTLCQFRERFPPCWTERGVIRNIVVLKKDTNILPTGFGKALTFRF